MAISIGDIGWSPKIPKRPKTTFSPDNWVYPNPFVWDNTNYNADNSSSAYNPVSQHHAIPCAGPIDRGSNNQDSTS